MCLHNPQLAAFILVEFQPFPEMTTRQRFRRRQGAVFSIGSPSSFKDSTLYSTAGRSVRSINASVTAMKRTDGATVPPIPLDCREKQGEAQRERERDIDILQDR